jgi:hypothetical protein
MIIATDQHHIGGLEKIVEYNLNKIDPIVAIGDMSVTQSSSKSRESILKKYQFGLKKELYKDMPEREAKKKELTTEQKKQAHEKGILTAKKDEFEDLLIWYGGGPIYNLARKVYVGSLMNNENKKIKVYKGSEPLIDHAQGIIYKKLMDDKKLSKDQVMDYIINLISRKKKRLMDYVYKHLEVIPQQETHKIEDILKQLLSINNFSGEIPTSGKIYTSQTGISGEEGFSYMEKVEKEVRDSTFIIHIPYFETYDESLTNIQAIETELIREIKRAEMPYCLILSHANPNPHEGMRGSERRDHNKDPITHLCREIVKEINYRKGDINMLTGHLHVSWKKYDWKEVYPIQIKPLGVKDVATVDTINNKIIVRKYE